MKSQVSTPELACSDVNFQSFVNCKLIFKDGTQQVLWAFVPPGVSFEDIIMGLNKAFEESGNVYSVEKEVYTLQKNKPVSLFSCYCKKIFK